MIFALLSVALSINSAATLGTKLLNTQLRAPQAQVAAAPSAAPVVPTAAPAQVVAPQPQQIAAAAEPAPWIAVRSDIHAGISRVRHAAPRSTKHAGHAR